MSGISATFPALFRQTAARYAMHDQPAISDANARLTYDELWRAVSVATASLTEAEIGRGDRIVLLQQRGVDSIVTLLALLTMGASVAVLSNREPASELSGKVRAGGMSYILHDVENRRLAQELADLSGVLPMSVAGRQSSDEASIEPAAQPEDEALIIFTSGSSGEPKAVQISQSNIVSNGLGVAQATCLREGDHLLHCMPLHHTNGLLNQILLPLMIGARVTLMDEFRADAFFSQMCLHQPTIITGVPTMYSRLLAHEVPEKALTRLRFARCGSAPLPEELHRRIEAHLGVEVIVSYGQTEATCTSTVNPPGARKIGSVGVALPGQEVAILSVDHEEVLGKRSVGEVAVRGRNIAMGYINAERFAPDRWLRTGDCGYLDDEGYLFLTGRLKEIIIRGGENLSPTQIEMALATFPGVDNCCVCGVPDTDLGEVPAAFIVMDKTYSGARKFSTQEINAHIGAKLSRSHQLKYAFQLDELPMNAVGKIDRKALAERARRSVKSCTQS